MADPPLEGMPSTQPDGRKMDADITSHSSRVMKSPGEPKSCLLLKKLPAELRVRVYEMAFTSHHKLNDAVAIFAPKPPSKNLLANQEARACYKQAYQKYWRETKFYYNEYEHARRITQSPMKQSVLDRDLDQITSMTITSVDAISLPGVESRTV
ncbi:hypothetical protein Slin15195_G021240 [Septoria linicola]|uniref:Uncharacterized protein n=1 Tax=Septoria linicola TaxID=215465 RepID=A0A9Q9ALT4_9PEZI|nr:hypothetical protein Slin15195_G021240 [Septoria linicola]